MPATVVILDKPKELVGLDQKVSGWSDVLTPSDTDIIPTGR